MKFNDLRTAMKCTEDVEKKYFTKHGREITPPEMSQSEDTRIEITPTGAESRRATFCIRALDDAKQQAKLAKTAIDKYSDSLVEFADEFTEDWEKAYSVLIQSQSMQATVSKQEQDKTVKEVDWDLFYEKLCSTYKDLEGAFAAIKMAATKSKTQKARKRGVNVKSIKAAESVVREALGDSINFAVSKFLNFIRKRIRRAEAVLQEVRADLEKAGVSFKSDLESMVDNPDYYKGEAEEFKSEM